MLDGGLAWSVAHFGEFGLVSGELGIDGCKFDIDRSYTVVDLRGLRGLAGGLGQRGGEERRKRPTFAMAELSVGFGAELFAPKSRFILKDLEYHCSRRSVQEHPVDSRLCGRSVRIVYICCLGEERVARSGRPSRRVLKVHRAGLDIRIL